VWFFPLLNEKAELLPVAPKKKQSVARVLGGLEQLYHEKDEYISYHEYSVS
jgi:hypothetical protein